ncbi:hypothetical protein Tco_1027555 [Tanacetum coccineum]
MNSANETELNQPAESSSAVPISETQQPKENQPVEHGINGGIQCGALIKVDIEATNGLSLIYSEVIRGRSVLIEKGRVGMGRNGLGDGYELKPDTGKIMTQGAGSHLEGSLEAKESQRQRSLELKKMTNQV